LASKRSSANSPVRIATSPGCISLFLGIVTVLPFSTRLLADFLAYRTAFLVYWVNIVVLGAFLYVTWAYAERAKLIREEAVGKVSRAVKRRIVVAQSLYAIGALAGLINGRSGSF
jgi:uncharacterized membrane protein